MHKNSGPFALSSMVIETLSNEEACRLRARGRATAATFENHAEQALRLSLLSTFGRSTLDGQTRGGICHAETAALLALANTPCGSLDELALKASIAGAVCPAARDDNLAIVLQAALDADARRLAHDLIAQADTTRLSADAVVVAG